MANHYDNAYEQDEISVFLQQILLRSSSSSSSSSCCFQSSAAHYEHHALAPQNQERPVMMISQSHDAGLGYEAEDCYCDYESEEGIAEALLPKKKQPGGSSKRSRAAEVHNLSEKRRRSRINEKMKALQNLIPNSNKSDKASMLDEAIEYLKQLQLQVQMLTMRNGLSLYPMMLHNYNQASLMGMDTIKDRNNSNDDLVNNIDRQDISEDAQALGLLHGNRSKQRALFPSLSNIIGSKPTFETEPFQLSAEAKDKALKIQSLHQDFSRADHKETNYELGDKTSSLVAFESMQLNTNPVFSQELNMSQIGWAPTHDHEKVKGKEIVKDWDLFMY